MSLEQQYRKFTHRLDSAERHFAEFRANFNGKFRSRDWMFLEGLLSTTWQHWGHFCRKVIIESCLGTSTSEGVVTASCVTPACWERVSYIASSVARNRNPQDGALNSDLWKEPTWGDTQKLQSIIEKLGPNNKNTLISSFGSTNIISHIQTVRNAAAHRHRQNVGDVMALAPYYSAGPLRHPVEAAFWMEEQYKQPAFLFWLSEMKLVGELAIK